MENDNDKQQQDSTNGARPYVPPNMETDRPTTPVQPIPSPAPAGETLADKCRRLEATDLRHQEVIRDLQKVVAEQQAKITRLKDYTNGLCISRDNEMGTKTVTAVGSPAWAVHTPGSSMILVRKRSDKEG